MTSPMGQPHEITLAKLLDPYSLKARAIAGIRSITPERIEWRKIDWVKKDGKVQ